MKTSRTIIVGLGNPILGDDGIGWRVAEALDAQLNKADVDVVFSSRGGLQLMETLVGYERAILIDAIVSKEEAFSSVSSFAIEELPEVISRHTVSAHDTSLKQALDMGKRVGMDLPRRIDIVAIASAPKLQFSDQMSEEVIGAIPKACKQVLDLLSVERQIESEETKRQRKEAKRARA